MASEKCRSNLRNYVLLQSALNPTRGGGSKRAVDTRADGLQDGDGYTKVYSRTMSNESGFIINSVPQRTQFSHQS